jgi:RNA recognition motif-containing protein
MQLTCRKCGKNHLTIKCNNSGGSNEKKEVTKELNYRKFNDNKFQKNKKEYKVKINNLPVDISFNELSNLLKDWGHINKINIKNFTESSYAIIEFQYEDEQIYFIEALNSTPFQHQIISVEKLDNL